MFSQEVKRPRQITYHFLRSKDTHEEQGITFITLFYRLTREFDEIIGDTCFRKVETVCVEIDELRQDFAPKNIQSTANEMHEYTVSEEIFSALQTLAKEHPEKLHLLTPLYQSAQRQRLIPRFPAMA